MSDNKDDSNVRVICMMCKYYEKGLFNLMVCKKCCHYIEYDVKYVPYHIECKKKNTQTSDPVNNPSHYTDGKIEVIDYICDKFDSKSFCLGNAIKYISRAGKKNNEVEDLRKAIWYINHYIEVIGGEGK